MKNLFKTLSFFSFVALMSSCYKEPTFDLTPSIEFKSLERDVRLEIFTGALVDSVVVGVSFQDGDGDLGLNETEKNAAQKTQDFNYIIKASRKKNGIFINRPSSIPLSGYFSRLKDDGKVGPIEGVLYYSLLFPTAFTPKNDTVKFAIQLKDRAGNVSNVVESDELILNIAR